MPVIMILFILESRALLKKLITKLPSYLGYDSNKLLESLPLEKLSVVLNQISKTKICQLENIQNPYITALPGVRHQIIT